MKIRRVAVVCSSTSSAHNPQPGMTATATKMTRCVLLLALLAVHARGQAAVSKEGCAMYEADGALVIETSEGRGDLVVDGMRIGGALKALEASVATCCAETAKQASAPPTATAPAPAPSVPATDT